MSLVWRWWTQTQSRGFDLVFIELCRVAEAVGTGLGTGQGVVLIGTGQIEGEASVRRDMMIDCQRVWKSVADVSAKLIYTTKMNTEI